MTKEQRALVIAIFYFFLLPFVVSLAFWWSAWVGVPLLFLAVPLWLGSAVTLAKANL